VELPQLPWHLRQASVSTQTAPPPVRQLDIGTALTRTAPLLSTLITCYNPLRPEALLGTPEDVVRIARSAEDDGFDVLCVADMGIADVTAALTLVAQETRSAVVSTRVIGALSRSPVHLASASAWLDHISGGRFALGLGASAPLFMENLHGQRMQKPAAAMADTLKIVRALFGDDLEGVTRSTQGTVAYHGVVRSVRAAVLDLVPRRGGVPLWLAAAGPKMLELAGALADGVILQYVTPSYLSWALSMVRKGAEVVGRSLEGFEVCVEMIVMTDVEDPALQARQEGWMRALIEHCTWSQFDHVWEEAGLTEALGLLREAVATGDEQRACAVAYAGILPGLTETGRPADAGARFLRRLVELRDLGATMLALPTEIDALIGWRPSAIRAALAAPDGGANSTGAADKERR